MESVGDRLPVGLFLGLLGLGAFLWSLKSGQFDDLDGAAERILLDDDERPHQKSSENSGETPEEKPEARR